MTSPSLLLSRGAVLLLSLCLLSRSSNALSNGAAGCEGGQAAVSGLHNSQETVLTGPLSMDDIELQINGQALQPGVPFDITVGVDYNWKLITAGTYFRGFLVRLGRGDGNVDTRQSLTVSGYTAKVADTTCVDAYNVGGVTHNSNVLKNLEQGTLAVHLPSDNMLVDVTVVIQNRNGYSIYYYSQFTLHANAGNNANPTVPESHATPTYTPYFPPPTAEPSKTPAPVVVNETSTAAPVTPAPVTPAPVTPAPVTPAPVTAAPVTATLAPVNPAPVAPTPAPVVQYLFLRYPTCSTVSQCSICQGDCDSDEECSGTMECFHRPQEDTSPVPGCVGTGVSGRDYCYQPRANSLRPRIPECTTENPCSACYGDCDDDTQCQTGLQCALREEGQLTPVFGCSGLGIAGLDYCYNASAVNEAANLAIGDREDEAGNATVALPGYNFTTAAADTAVPEAANNITTAPIVAEEDEDEDSDFSSNDQTTLVTSVAACSAASPCGECLGDCESDDNACSGDLLCFVRPNNDMTIVPGCPGTGTAGTDYCWRPVANTLTIRTQVCSEDSPCQKCQGGCSGNADCATGLACFLRQDMSVVPGCGNGFRSVNFCWDPNDFSRQLRH